jgi:hypothetical protein
MTSARYYTDSTAGMVTVAATASAAIMPWHPAPLRLYLRCQPSSSQCLKQEQQQLLVCSDAALITLCLPGYSYGYQPRHGLLQPLLRTASLQPGPSRSAGSSSTVEHRAVQLAVAIGRMLQLIIAARSRLHVQRNHALEHHWSCSTLSGSQQVKFTW